MKVILLQHESKTVGWKLKAENKEDKLRLGSIRNIQFFGLDDTAIRYSGMKGEGDYVAELSWAQKKFVKDGNNMDAPTLTEK